MRTFAQGLRAFRSMSGLSRPQLIDELGISSGTAGNWEKGVMPALPLMRPVLENLRLMARWSEEDLELFLNTSRSIPTKTQVEEYYNLSKGITGHKHWLAIAETELPIKEPLDLPDLISGDMAKLINAAVELHESGLEWLLLSEIAEKAGVKYNSAYQAISRASSAYKKKYFARSASRMSGYGAPYLFKLTNCQKVDKLSYITLSDFVDMIPSYDGSEHSHLIYSSLGPQRSRLYSSLYTCAKSGKLKVDRSNRAFRIRPLDLMSFVNRHRAFLGFPLKMWR